MTSACLNPGNGHLADVRPTPRDYDAIITTADDVGFTRASTRGGRTRGFILLFTMIAATLVTVGGVALAVNKIGTNVADNLLGSGGHTDTPSGGDGDDLLDAINQLAKRDISSCGRGFDRVFADSKDAVATDCEKVAVGPAAAEKLSQQPGNAGFFARSFNGLAPFPE